MTKVAALNVAMHLSKGDKTQDVGTRYLNPGNAQLTKLKEDADKAKSEGGDCANWVMFGEYLQALEDTYGHRDAYNKPIPIRMGFGHALEGHNPDYTYSEDPDYKENDPYVRARIWAERPLRTAAMEEAVFNLFKNMPGEKGAGKSWDEVKSIVDEFNAYKESDETGFKYKLELLQKTLIKWGYTSFSDSAGNEFDLNLMKAGQGKYDSLVGEVNRNCSLKYTEDGDGHKAGDTFKESDFPGTILGGGGNCD